MHRVWLPLLQILHIRPDFSPHPPKVERQCWVFHCEPRCEPSLRFRVSQKDCSQSKQKREWHVVVVPRHGDNSLGNEWSNHRRCLANLLPLHQYAMCGNSHSTSGGGFTTENREKKRNLHERQRLGNIYTRMTGRRTFGSEVTPRISWSGWKRTMDRPVSRRMPDRAFHSNSACFE